MEFKDSTYVFDVDKVTKVWCAINDERALCNHKKIPVNVRTNKNGKNTKSTQQFAAEIKVNCALERIEDYLNYINQYKLVKDWEQSNAFNFIEILNCEYIIVHCIQELAKTYDVEFSTITNVRSCFSNIQYGAGSDGEVFEYVRSLCAVHPAETSYHPQVHNFDNFNSCSRIKWDDGFGYDERDLTAVIYSADRDGEAMYLGIQVESFMRYLKKWVELLDDIEKGIRDYIEKEKDEYRKKVIANPDDFDNYLDYIDNLRMEYEQRYSDSHIHLFERYKLVFTIKFDNPVIEQKRICYKNAVKYMFECLHKQLQGMNERENTGIVDLEDNVTTNLFFELDYPISTGSEFANDMGAFAYVENLSSSVEYDRKRAREVLNHIKPIVNKYVEFNNTEPREETDLLLQIATYFDALQHDGYINRSIPNTEAFRGK